jgi:subtilisin family serine protease
MTLFRSFFSLVIVTAMFMAAMPGASIAVPFAKPGRDDVAPTVPLQTVQFTIGGGGIGIGSIPGIGRRRGGRGGYDGYDRKPRRGLRFRPRIQVEIDDRRDWKRRKRTRRERNWRRRDKVRRDRNAARKRRAVERRRDKWRKKKRKRVSISKPDRTDCRRKGYVRRGRKCHPKGYPGKVRITVPVIIIDPPDRDDYDRIPDTRKPPKRTRKVRRYRSTPKLPVPRPVPGRAGPPSVIVASQQQLWPGEVIVQLERSATSATELAIARSHNLTRVSSETNELVGRRIVKYRFADRRQVQAVAASLAAHPLVIRAQPNWYYQVSQSAGTGVQRASAATSLQYAAKKLGLAEAHAIARGRGVRLAVIDSGVDSKHPAFAGALRQAFDAAPGRGDKIGKHGTAIVGIVKARGIVTGVAPSADVLAVRAFFSKRADGPERSSTAIIMRALDWAVANKAQIVNMSFAGPHDEAIEEAIGAARQKGVVLIAAAGNGGAKAAPAYPAAYEDVIAVTATDPNDRLYRQANRGSYVDVAAPGVDVLVLAPSKAYKHDSGTSFAAAHVSGIIALLLERDRALDAGTISRMLSEEAADRGQPGRDVEFGAGTVNAVKMLRATTVNVAKQ